MNYDYINIDKHRRLTVKLIEERTLPNGDKKESHLGSGLILFYGGQTFVLTAGHCIENASDRNNIQYLLKTGKGSFMPLEVTPTVHIVYDEATSTDYAVLKAKYPHGVALTTDSVKLKDFESEKQSEWNTLKYMIYGYTQKACSGVPLNAEYAFEDNWKFPDVKDGLYETFHDIINGVSGSGVLRVSDKGFNCAGILTNCLDEAGVFSIVHAASADYLLGLINGLIGSVPEKPTSMPTQFSDVQSYIPRFCATSKQDTMSLYLQREEKRYSLRDYVKGNVPGLLSLHFLLTASAQTGKSYELKHLSYQLSSDGYEVVFIEANDLVNGWYQLLPVEEFVNGNKLAIIIDAIDECTIDPAQISNDIKAYVEEQPSVLMIVSCRENYKIDNELQSFTHLYLSDLTVHDAIEYVEGSGNGDVINRMKPYFDNSELHSLLTVPFMLSTLVSFAASHQKMPKSKIELYGLYIDHCYPRLEIGEDESIRVKAKIREQWRRLAILMLRLNKFKFSKDDVRLILGEDISPITCKKLFVIVEDEVSFINNALKEYLAAEYLSQKEFKEITSCVCYKGTNKIKSQWYNVVTMWLQMISVDVDELPLPIVQWLSDFDIELLMNADRRCLQDETRLTIAKNILYKHRDKHTFYSAIYEDKSVILYKFAESDIFSRFLLDELILCKEDSHHLYNLHCLVPYVNWDVLKKSSSELYGTFVDTLFDKVKNFGNVEGCMACFYFAILGNGRHFYQDPNFVASLVEIVRPFDNYLAVDAIAAICYHGYWSDRFIDYLLAKEYLLHNKGSLVVSRSTLYKAFSRVMETENIIKVLSLVSEKEYLRYENSLDDYKEMIDSILGNVVANLEHGRTDNYDYITEIFFNLVGKDKVPLFSYTSQVLFPIYAKFFRAVGCEDEVVLSRINFIEHYGEHTPEEMAAIRDRWQREFDEMCDYSTFKAIVVKAIDEGPDFADNVTSAIMDYSNKYVARFLITACSLRQYRATEARAAIDNNLKYDLFRMYVVIDALMGKEMHVIVSDAVKKECNELAYLILSNKINARYDFVLQALKMVIRGFLVVPEDLLFDLLLKYANESASIPSAEPFNNDSKTLFQFALESVDEERMNEFLTHVITHPDRVNEREYSTFASYILANGDKEAKDTIYAFMKDHIGKGISSYLIQMFIDHEDYYGRLLDLYDSLDATDQFVIAGTLKDVAEYSDQIRERLECDLDKGNYYYRRQVLNILFSIGSMKALVYAVNNKAESFRNGEFYTLKYSNVESLPMLLDLYQYLISLDGIYQSVALSILESISNIAIQSRDNMTVVEDGIANIIKQNPRYGFLNNFIARMEERYEQRVDTAITLEEAIALT